MSELRFFCVCRKDAVLAVQIDFKKEYISRVSRGSSVSIMSDYGLDDRGWIPDRGRGFFISPLLSHGSGAHPASYTMGTGGSFPRG
jgi:hypothetical protein